MKHKIYSLYENKIMAGRLGRFEIFRKGSEFLLYILFKKHKIKSIVKSVFDKLKTILGIRPESRYIYEYGIVAKANGQKKIAHCDECGGEFEHKSYGLHGEDTTMWICTNCFDKVWNAQPEWTITHNGYPLTTEDAISQKLKATLKCSYCKTFTTHHMENVIDSRNGALVATWICNECGLGIYNLDGDSNNVDL